MTVLTRWTAIAFAGVGSAAKDWSELSSARVAGGGGVGFRYLLAKKFGIRSGVDVAVGTGASRSSTFRTAPPGNERRAASAPAQPPSARCGAAVAGALVDVGLPVRRGALLVALERAAVASRDSPLRCGDAPWLLAVVAWLPLVLLTAMQRGAGESTPWLAPLLDVRIISRYLLALPVLILTEPVFIGRLSGIVMHFQRAGFVRRADNARFTRILARSARAAAAPLRRGRHPAPRLRRLAPAAVARETASAVWQLQNVTENPRLSSNAQWWLAIVSQPLFLIFVARWCWRSLVWFRTLRCIARLDLNMVPAHPGSRRRPAVRRAVHSGAGAVRLRARLCAGGRDRRLDGASSSRPDDPARRRRHAAGIPAPHRDRPPLLAVDADAGVAAPAASSSMASWRRGSAAASRRAGCASGASSRATRSPPRTSRRRSTSTRS